MAKQQFSNVLLTGASGKLGGAIQKSGFFKNLMTPSHQELDIADEKVVEKYFLEHEIDAVIHTAALARMKVCETNPLLALETNIIGTSNLVNSVLKAEKRSLKKNRFVHISTDGVYEGTKGNYRETDPTIPYNNYGWTKLGAECAVKLLSNYCIIRTRFFDPEQIKFDTAATDIFSSSLPITDLVKAIQLLLNSDFVGIINVGNERKSDFERIREFKPEIQPTTFAQIQEEALIPLAQDASLDTSLWQKIQKMEKKV